MFLITYFVAFVAGEADGSSAVALMGLQTHWTGKAVDPFIFIGTADGKIHYVDILNGNVLWSLDTEGPVFSSTETGATTYVPSLDGYLFAFVKNYGYRRVPLPMRDLDFLAPFKTETGEVFQSAKSTQLFFLNEWGEVTSSYKSNTSVPTQAGVAMGRQMTIVRINYAISVVSSDPEEQWCKVVRYSEFDICTGKESDVLAHEIEVTTGFNGGVTISVNGTITSQLYLRGVPVSVYGPEGRFDFHVDMNGHPLGKHAVVFLTLEGYHVAIPVKPLKTPAKVEMLMHGLPALAGDQAPKVSDSFALGIQNVKRPFFLFESYKKGDPNRPANMVELFEGMLAPAPSIQIPYQTISVVHVLLFCVLSLINYLLDRLKNVQRIEIDATNPEKGTIGNVPCTIAKSRIMEEEVLIYLCSMPLHGIAKVNGFEKRGDDWIIAYQQLQPWDFSDFSAIPFLRNMLQALSELFKAGFVHGSIDETALFKDNKGNLVIGKLERRLQMSTRLHERAKDIRDLAEVVHRHVRQEGMDPLLMDLLVDMRDPIPEERPTVEEALRHPLFWDAGKKLDLFSTASAFLQSKQAVQARIDFDSCDKELCNGDWEQYVRPDLIREAMSGNRIQYDSRLPSSLVRLIRNKWQHKPDETQVPNFPKDAAAFFEYFHELFPTLFLYTYYFVDRYIPDAKSVCESANE